MAIDYIQWGDSFPDLSPDHLSQVSAKNILSICNLSKDFEVIELRSLINDGILNDIIVVDCVNELVPSRNTFGIKVRERLALVFNQEKSSEVRALRKNFPYVPHLNHVLSDEPTSLCLYFEPWSVIERIWTPQKHLQRILWWLSETAKGTLHRPDQPLERIYFEPPFEILFPPDFDEKIIDESLILTTNIIKPSVGDFKIIRAHFITKLQAASQGHPEFVPIFITLQPVLHGGVEHYPDTFGVLHDQIKARGGSFINDVKEVIRIKADGGLVHKQNGRCLLILQIPTCRTLCADPERIETQAFLIPHDLSEVGEATGVLHRFENKFYNDTSIGAGPVIENNSWRDLKVLPIGVAPTISSDFVRALSGVVKNTADFRGVLAGLGSLGSALAELWAKEAWGTWSLIDSDYVKSHNVLRHVARDVHIGQYKVDVVKAFMEGNYHQCCYSVKTLPDKIQNRIKGAVDEIISTADLLVDVTTTLEVPRDLSQQNAVPRSASVFLSPSGKSSVLLFEEENRGIRLDSLEAQYYRAIINSDWGASHLVGHNGTMWVGAGCRDASAIISFEMIMLHAATLARQIRLLRANPESCIRVWTADENSGALDAQNIHVQACCYATLGEWKVVWDLGIKQKLCGIRNANLPSETGGVILGYIDHKIRAVIIVDVLSAPPDSEADRTGFIRGIVGLECALKEVAQRTANIVGYIGEWHSHPAFTSAYPSPTDRILVAKLAETLALDGQPALMVIVGESGDISFTMGAK